MTRGKLMEDWAVDESAVSRAIAKQTKAALGAYREDNQLIEEHAAQERETKSGGYGRRQLFELVQNAADQLKRGDGRIHVVLTDDALYCANSGEPFSAKGIESILHAYLSRKDDEKIGRFGLGFKSVLGVTSTPMLLSRSGSFRFGADVADQIRKVVPAAEDVPLLRVAASMDPHEIIDDDSLAEELASWASTVIVLPFDDRRPLGWLSAHCRDFPAQFLAFAGHVDELVIEDRSGDRIETRRLTAERGRDQVLIRDGADETKWLLFEYDVPLSTTAREAAGKLADREEVTVKWAVPPEGSVKLGSLWSYFPTKDETTLRGVLNAPWQLTDDRLMLVEGDYNEALLEGAARLVLDSIPTLRVHAADPTRFLELMPGRGREPRCWADSFITAQINDRLADEEAIPLQSGEFGIAMAAQLHPPDLPDEAFALWSALVEDPGEWVHQAVDKQKDRRSRIERYLEAKANATKSLSDWFEAALEGLDAEAPDAAGKSAIACRLAGALEGLEGAPGLAEVQFVLRAEGGFVSPNHPGLMLPGEYEVRDDDVCLVHPELAADVAACDALDLFGVERVSSEAELRRLLISAPADGSGEWEYFWSVVREVPQPDALRLIKGADFEPHVKVMSGEFRRIGATLLPGRCVPVDGSRDAHAAVDQQWHSAEVKLLQVLGAFDAPRQLKRVPNEPWFEAYVEEARDRVQEINRPAKLAPDSISLDHASEVPFPLASLAGLSGEGKAAVSEAALELLESPTTWTASHTNGGYKAVHLPNPAIWLVRAEGMLATPWGARAPSDCVSPDLQAADLLPAPKCRSTVAQALSLPAAWAEVPGELLEEIFDRAEAGAPEDAVQLYRAMAVEEGPEPPALLRCLESGAPAVTELGRVLVTDIPSHLELISQGSQPILPLVDAETKDALIRLWGLSDAGEVVKRRTAFVPFGERTMLIDQFPPLKKLLAATDRTMELQRCEEIRVIEEAVGGTRSEDVTFCREEDCILVDADVSDRSVLREVGREFGLSIDTERIDRILKGVEDHKTKQLIRDVRSAATDTERTAVLFSDDELKGQLPRSVLETYEELHHPPSGRDLAELAISAHGTGLLKEYADDLEEKGLTPPSFWAGSRRAREFVRSLGYSLEMAGFESEKRPPELVVEGRPAMPPLHDYQETIAEAMAELLEADRDNRAMLSLPTGAGKTRVAIEGIIKAHQDGGLRAPLLLWVAQSDELCEQAVAAWGELWRASEIEDRLVISRLWSGNDAAPAEMSFQVVVATIQKLGVIMGREEYDWLKTPGALVIDEAHGAIAKGYTALLEWLGLERGKTGIPLVGLSATPYRGRSEELTDRLAKRFGNLRLDIQALGNVDHYRLLQDRGVISRVRHETLEGSDVHLPADQLQELLKKGLLPKAADTKLGENVPRTKRVLESIAAQPADWPILVFAPSVENSQALAGLLNKEGISAAAIYGEMPREARRFYIREFREGRLRVLTNYNVLAEGFDAPAVRAVYIARPVFAPNRYQQMVGRGLRGPRNGGKEECLIVDVEDNVINFEEQLAFTQFEYLWTPETAVAPA